MLEMARNAAREAALTAAAATMGAIVLPKMQREGLRWEGRARRRAAALGSLWLESATRLAMAALRGPPSVISELL
jgi:hypothetical protein